MRLLYLLPAIAVCSNIAAQKPLTIDNTTPGGKEYKELRPHHAAALFDSNSRLITKADNPELYDSIEFVVGRDIIRTKAQSYDRNDVSGNFAYRYNDKLYIMGKDSVPVMMESAEGAVVGDAVHRNEFGIEKGTFWSQQGDKLAYYEMDESMVSEYPIVDITSRIASTKPIRYPMAGETSHLVKVKVYDTATKRTVTLDTDMKGDSYFTNISWRPDGKALCLAEVNRAQDTMKFNIYDAESGKLIKTLFTETDNRWIEPCHPACFIDNNNLAWLSDRDGFTHIYLYNIENNKCTQLTSGDWSVSRIYGYSPKSKELFFQSNERGYLYRDIYAVTLKGKRRCLTADEAGMHSALFAPDMTTFIDYFSSPDVATRTTWCNNKGIKLKQLGETAKPYDGYTLPTMELKTVMSADNKYELTGVLIKPSDFDSSKRYPVVIYTYGGPHSQLVNAGWLYGTSPWLMYLAEQGYIVWTMDNRGTELRGREFEKCIHRRLGECERADQMQGVKYLKSLPYVDSDRIGVHGWSYGGFMTLTLMSEEPETFKVGVAGGPVVDWSLYEVMYGERYMDTPQENRDGYKSTSILDKVENIKGNTLVIHGDIDPVVVWQHSLQLLKKSVDKDVMIDYAVYPQHEHNVRGGDRVHLIKRIVRYFDDYLKR